MICCVLIDGPIPIYVLNCDETIPLGVSYPLERVSKTVPYNYFTSTFAYQLALAIIEGFTNIILHGIQFTGGRERLVEKACLEYWIGVARGHGITVTQSGPVQQLPLTRSTLLYGYDYWPEKQQMERYCHDSIPYVVHDAFYGSS